MFKCNVASLIIIFMKSKSRIAFKLCTEILILLGLLYAGLWAFGDESSRGLQTIVTILTGLIIAGLLATLVCLQFIYKPLSTSKLPTVQSTAPGPVC